VHVARQLQHGFFLRERELVQHARQRLADVEALATAGQAVDVMQQVVAVADLQNLTDPNSHHPGRVNTSALVDRHRLRRDGSLRKRSREVDEHVRHAPVQRRQDGFLDDALAGIDPCAHRVPGHSNHRVAGQFTEEANMPSNRSASPGLRSGAGDAADTRQDDHATHQDTGAQVHR
jgi:hypothetical protein